MDTLIPLIKEPFFLYTLFTIFLKEANYERFYTYSKVCKAWYLISKDVLLNYLRIQLPKCIKPYTSLVKIPNEFIAYPVNINSISVIRKHTINHIYPINNSRELSVYWINGIIDDNKIVLIKLSYYGENISLNRCKNAGYTFVDPDDIISCLTGSRLKLK
jgi:hypothetical protein